MSFMMKNEIKGSVLGALSTGIICSGASIATGQFVSIDVVPNNVKKFAFQFHLQ